MGKAESIPARVIEGDGEAFRLSGRALEAMGGRRLVYAAPEGSALNDWDVACRLLDELAMGWTARQARAVLGLSAHVRRRPRRALVRAKRAAAEFGDLNGGIKVIIGLGVYFQRFRVPSDFDFKILIVFYPNRVLFSGPGQI